jgi:hypothetical protein
MLQERDALGLTYVAADIEGDNFASGARRETTIVEHRVGEDRSAAVEARQALDRFDIADGVRRAYAEIYDGLIANARDGEHASQLRVERDAVLASLVGFRPNESGSYEFVLDTTLVDRLGHDVHWSFERFRAAVESSERVALGFDRSPGSTVVGSNAGITARTVGGRSSGSLYVALTPDLQRREGPRNFEWLGQTVVHESAAHVWSRVALPASARHTGGHITDRGRRPSQGPRSTADLIDDWLRRAIPIEREGPIQQAPSWDWAPSEDEGR